MSRKELFRRDFSVQCGRWRKEDKILAITTYQKKHNMDGPLQIMLESKVGKLIKFLHKYWGTVLLNTYISGSLPIDTGYRYPETESKYLHATLYKQPWRS